MSDNVPGNIKIPGKDEIYAQIAFQEQFYNGVLAEDKNHGII